MEIKPIKMMMESKIGFINNFGNYAAYIWQYRSIFKLLVKNEFKGRFKNTVLGYFWHLLTPLTMILLYYFIFSMFFGKEIPNYWVYVSTGIFAYTLFTYNVSAGSDAIVSNSRYITKMAMPKEMVVFARVGTSLINVTISYSLVILCMIISGVGITANILFVPIIISFFALFCLGLELIVSALTVYIRDISNALKLILGIMMFALPVVYLAEQRSTPYMEFFWSINPIYYYIETIHDTMYWGTIPDIFQLAICLMCGPVFLILGLIIFKKLENGFAERL